MTDVKLMEIGEVSRKLGVTLRALRFWQDKGLLDPIRDGTRRLYDQRQFERARRINAWGDAGVPLRRMAKLLDLLEAGRADAAAAFAAPLIDKARREAEQRLAAIDKVQKAEKIAA